MRTVVLGDKKLHLTAMTLLLTYPGVPSIFAGDEIGLEGFSGEDSRRTFNWEDTSSWVLVEDDCLAFLRESKKETILVFVSRKAVKTSIDLSKLGYVVKKSLYGISGDGAKITINEGSPAQGVWVLESNQK